MKKYTIKDEVLFSAAGFAAGTMLVCIGTLIVYMVGGIQWVAQGFQTEKLVWSVLFILLVSAAEEYIFRKIILKRLAKKFNLWLALFISSLVFGAVHLTNANITPLAITNIFLGGMLFGTAYLATRSLAFVIFLHFGWNCIQGPVLGFSVSGLPFESLLKIELIRNNLINGGHFGLEGSIVCSTLLLISVLGCILVIEK